VMALFIVYQLYYTNVVGRQEMSDEVSTLHKQWSATQPVAAATITPSYSPCLRQECLPKPPAPKPGSGVAILHIPRLGPDSVKTGTPVLEGVGMDILNKASGHYPGSAMPGAVGNFSVAGHRKTHGEPFRHLDEIRSGDLVFVETAGFWFTYQIDGDPVVVPPTDTGVVDPVPGRPGVPPTKNLITLTTCNPWWSSTQRMIVVGHLTDTRPAASGPPPGLRTP
jgi:sortase A